MNIFITSSCGGVPKLCLGRGNCGKCKVCNIIPPEDKKARYKILKKGYLPPIIDYSPLVKKECYSKHTVVRFKDKIIGRERGKTTSLSYAVAVDIGTTTIVVSLVDMNKQKEIETASLINPQNSYGLDVVSRIQKAKNKKDLLAMQRMVLNTVNKCIGELSRRRKVKRENIYAVVVAGNPTMIHLFLGVSPKSLGEAPYLPAFFSATSLPAKKLGLNICDFGLVYCLPLVSGYIGGDVVAGIIATSSLRKNNTSFLIDLGTNGEIVLFYQGKMVACSCAAGPALEGANISCGMIAQNGAIEKVIIDDNSVKCKTIGNKKPRGICGSGIIEGVAELIRVGMINSSGRLQNSKNLKLNKKLIPPRFILTSSKNGKVTYISQKDIRNVQLAKAAISSGIKTLLKEANLSFKKIDRIYIAGAFGRYLRMMSLSRLGIIPPALIDRVFLVGNTSLSGAMLCLLSSSKIREAEKIAKDICCIELFTYPGYEKLFVEELLFPEK